MMDDIEKFAKSLCDERAQGNPAKLIHSKLFFWLSFGKALAINEASNYIPTSESDFGCRILNAARWILDVSNEFTEKEIIQLLQRVTSSRITPKKEHAKLYWEFLRTHTMIDAKNPPEVWTDVFQSLKTKSI